jgi:hypothetical protein
MKNKMEVSESINKEISRYRNPNSIKWKFVDEDDLVINKKFGLMHRKIKNLKKLNRHIKNLSDTIVRQQVSEIQSKN